MAPNSTEVTGVLHETDAATPDFGLSKIPVQQADNTDLKYEWHKVLMSSSVHMLGLYGGYLTLSAKWQTLIFTIIMYVISVFGITASAHRFFSHKSYKAKWPLRVILVIFNSVSWQNSALDWAHDHRVHHKYSDTDADPHNATRGFWFSHTGWLVRERHPEFVKKRAEMDVSDLYADPVCAFQHKYYVIMMPIFCFVLPTIIPTYLWGENAYIAFFVCGLFRFILSLHSTFLVNSAAHKFGSKPYDKTILSTENNFVSLFMLGEGYHNYHHTFPWDYKAGELGNTICNFTSIFIDFFSKIGWAYDLKAVSEEIIVKRAARTGDGTHSIWGWGDKDQSPNERETAIRINAKDK